MKGQYQVIPTIGEELLIVERFETLSDTMRSSAKAAVAFLVPLPADDVVVVLVLNIEEVHNFFSFSKSRT